MKVVLAYSGGLDTSVIIRWLQENYKADVITWTADIGQGEELNLAKEKAQKMGVSDIIVEDLRAEFARDFVFPMFRANAVYESEYLLGTSIARPLIAKRLIDIAKERNVQTIAHGATGKGNDQVRFELNAYALNPNIKIIAPWREWNLSSRSDLLQYAEDKNIPIDYQQQKNKAPYSMDANLLHISYEGGDLEDPNNEPKEDMWRWTKSPEKAADKVTYLRLHYQHGDIINIEEYDGITKRFIAINASLKPHEVMQYLNKIGGENGVGRSDIVENRFVGMKSRGCYESPAGVIMLKAHKAIEAITLDKEVAHLKDELMSKYATMIYNGFYFAPERQALQQLINQTQEQVSGTVTLKLYKGNVIITQRESADNSLFSKDISTFEDANDCSYNQQDAEGFIKINALRLKLFKGRGSNKNH